MENIENEIFLVAGATGTIGRQAVKELLKNGKTVRALSRNPQKTEFPENMT